MTRDMARELCGDKNLVFCDEYFDDCIVGVTFRNPHPPAVAYNLDRIVATIVADGKTYEEAADYVTNMLKGFSGGPRDPVFVGGLSIRDCP